MHCWIQQTRKEPPKKPTEDVPADLQLLLIEAKQTCAAREQKICGVEYH